MLGASLILMLKITGSSDEPVLILIKANINEIIGGSSLKLILAKILTWILYYLPQCYKKLDNLISQLQHQLRLKSMRLLVIIIWSFFWLKFQYNHCIIHLYMITLELFKVLA